MIYRPPKAKVGSFLWFFTILMGLATILVLWVSIRMVWGIGTLRYEVTPTEAVIVFGPSVIHIDREHITEITHLEGPTRGRRLVGTSTPGLKEGSWSFAETGRITLYATTTRSLVVIETADRKWGISPEDPQGFIDAVRTGQAAVFDPVQVSSTGSVLFGFFMSALILLVTAGVVLYMRRLATGIGYELGPDELIIHGSWRPIRVPYNSIESVSIENPPGYPVRYMGTGMPGLHWGSFGWKQLGPNVKIYATRLKPIVVVRTGNQTIGLSPEDDTGFLKELERMVGKR